MSKILGALLALCFAAAARAMPADWSTYQAVSSTPTVVILTTTGTGKTWTVPTGWQSTVWGSLGYANKIECIGGGQAGSGGSAGLTAYYGGTGATYSAAVNVSLTVGASINYTIGAGGAALTQTGFDTYFNATSCAASTVCAPGGGSASTAIGSTINSGGTGTGIALYGWAGGGGAGGPNGVGAQGTTSGGGAGDAGSGGAGGSTGGGLGGAGTEWGTGPNLGSGGGGGPNTTGTGGLGGSYGAGGGAGDSVSAFGDGNQGICRISYYTAQ